jgi:hypothetical protein
MSCRLQNLSITVAKPTPVVVPEILVSTKGDYSVTISCRHIYIYIQIPPSVSTIILSGQTQSFVGLEKSVALKID